MNVDLATGPRTGQNTQLWEIGATYGVRKAINDPVYWSATGY